MSRVSLIAPLVLLCSLAAVAHSSPNRPVPSPARAHNADGERRLDINNLNFFVRNDGTIGNGFEFAGGGLLFPRGTDNSVLYTAGLWVGGLVGGQPRLAVSEYSTEYGPGSMVGTSADNPSSPDYKVWKVLPWTGDPADTAHVDHTPEELLADPTMDPLAHHGWGEYMYYAAPHGAPVRMWTLPGPGGVGTQDVLGPDVIGDQMLWCVFNDADAALHVASPGSTAPLGIEVRQTVYGFSRLGPLSQTAFVRWRIFNNSGVPIDSARVALWLDPDLGGASDDLAGCDSIRSMGYTYNATNNDLQYGSTPPALGVDLVDDEFNAEHGRVLGMASFQRYVNGTDPVSSAESWNILRGAHRSGDGLVNPQSGLPTSYEVPGDPIQLTGWRDSLPSDRRMILVRSPRRLEPGDSVDVTAALIVSRGNDRLGSVALMQCFDDWLQSAYVAGFPIGMPVTSCVQPANCPRTANFYADECQGAGHLSVSQLQTLTTAVSGNATTDLLPDGQGADGFCWAMSHASDARLAAKREYATLLANMLAKPFGIQPSGTSPIVLDGAVPVSIPGLSATNLFELTVPGSTAVQFIAEYRNLEPAHPAALAGVNAGLRAFGGGADYAFDFFGSSLDPNTAPVDSFPVVQLFFDATHPQKAYRYLRLEQFDGTAPSTGREYRYAGYVDVPFVARDSVTGEQLEVAFSERTLTDADGTILDPSFQLATFDSTWSPDESQFGGREYVLVLHRTYGETPSPDVAVDGAVASPDLPWMYAMWARRVEAGSVIDDGDQFAFAYHHPEASGVDQRLLDLEDLSLGDPAVVAAYDEVTQALAAINNGVGVPTLCDDPTPALASLVDASAQPGHVDLDWFVSGVTSASVQRAVDDGEWLTMATIDADGSGHVRWQDTSVEAGRRYGYRLEFASDGAMAHSPAAWVEVPLQLRLAIAGFRPNPARADAAVAFTLAGRERATLELVDVSGRRVLSRDVGSMGPGTHTLALDQRLAPGIYWLRISQAGASASTRGVVIR